MSLDKTAILAFDDVKLEKVHVPEWGGHVYVRTMEAGERDAFEEGQIGATYKHLRARLAAATVCDVEGNLLFTKDDVPSLTTKSAKALDRIFAVSMKLSGLSKEDVEELKKNSSPTHSSDSSTS